MSWISVDARYQRGGFSLAVDMTIPAHGVTAILGASGSGKSTLLRLIAGLEHPQQGCIRAEEQCWFNSQSHICLPPQRRRVGMVFQDYALFNHFTVAQNVGFGLARLPQAEREARIGLWLERLHIQGLAGRYPHQLSGGQKQRAAIARALAPEPDILLLDEPLSAIDTHLRRQLRSELLGLVNTLNQPVLLVTHDLDEARHLADRIGVMVDGRLQCMGSVNQVFNHPVNAAVARVLGWRNLLAIREISGQMVSGPWGQLILNHEIDPSIGYLGIRSEHIHLHTKQEDGDISATLTRVIELGAVHELQCKLSNGQMLYVQRPWDEILPSPGSQVSLALPLQHLRLLGP